MLWTTRVRAQFLCVRTQDKQTGSSANHGRSAQAKDRDAGMLALEQVCVCLRRDNGLCREESIVEKTDNGVCSR